jgi:hypothetical protein
LVTDGNIDVDIDAVLSLIACAVLKPAGLPTEELLPMRALAVWRAEMLALHRRLTLAWVMALP